MVGPKKKMLCFRGHGRDFYGSVGRHFFFILQKVFFQCHLFFNIFFTCLISILELPKGQYCVISFTKMYTIITYTIIYLLKYIKARIGAVDKRLTPKKGYRVQVLVMPVVLSAAV